LICPRKQTPSDFRPDGEGKNAYKLVHTPDEEGGPEIFEERNKVSIYKCIGAQHLWVSWKRNIHEGGKEKGGEKGGRFALETQSLQGKM